MSYTQDEFNGRILDNKSRKVGDHVIRIRNELTLPGRRKLEHQSKVLENVLLSVNKLNSGIPDFDSGYMSVAGSGSYTLKHNLGIIPGFFRSFISTKEEPTNVDKCVAVETGVKYTAMNSEEITVVCPATFVDGNTSGYLRILLWR